MAGNKPPVNRAEIDTPVTEPIMIKTRLGGIVSDIAAEVASKATNSPSSAPRRRISGTERGDGRHVGGLGAGDAGHQKHRPQQHEG